MTRGRALVIVMVAIGAMTGLIIGEFAVKPQITGNAACIISTLEIGPGESTLASRVKCNEYEFPLRANGGPSLTKATLREPVICTTYLFFGRFTGEPILGSNSARDCKKR